jgi:hypothetical protein
LGRRIGWNFSMKEFELKFGITNSNYWSCWDTLDGVYHFDNDYSCEHDYKWTTNEFNGY